MMKRLCVIALMILWGSCAFAVQKSPTIVYINGSKYHIHTVQAGETLYALSKAYAVGERVILENNPTAIEGLRSGATVKIPFMADIPDVISDKKLRKTYDIHFVTKGQTLYSISRHFEIPIQTIVDDNPNVDPIHLRLGERILIRRKQIGSEDEVGSKEQWEQYRTSLNKVADVGIQYHMVLAGDTFYSLARRFGVTETQLSELNGGLKAADLKVGAIIKAPCTAQDVASTTTPAPSPQQPEVETLPENHVPEIEFRAAPHGVPLDVALLLPMVVGGDASDNFMEFYQGFLLGLDSVRTKYGYSVNLELYNTGRDSMKIRELTHDSAFRRARLIVGPVYEEGLYPVIRHAEQEKIPVVSPLAHIASINSDALFQLAPDPSTKYDKVAELINGDRDITLIYSSSTDKEYEREILALLQNSEYKTHTYNYVHPTSGRGEGSQSDLTPLLNNDRDNLFIIMSGNEVDVDRVLTALASADTGLASRGRTTPRYTVLGNARWNRYNNIDRTMFFRNRVTFISTYHAKRDAQVITDFDSSYIKAFSTLPTLYSYRGYDAAMLFVPAMYGDIEYDMEGRRFTPLQTTYMFGQGEQKSNHINRNWTRVNYNTDFTITIE